jgi:hypothetical protein
MDADHPPTGVPIPCRSTLADPAAHAGSSREFASNAERKPRRWRLSCSHNAEPSASALLIHEDAVLAIAQARVDGAPRERLSLCLLPSLAALDHLFGAPAHLVITEPLGISNDLAEDLGKGFKIIVRFHRNRPVQAREIAFPTAAILGRSGTGAAGTARQCLA